MHYDGSLYFVGSWTPGCGGTMLLRMWNNTAPPAHCEFDFSCNAGESWYELAQTGTSVCEPFSQVFFSPIPSGACGACGGLAFTAIVTLTDPGGNMPTGAMVAFAGGTPPSGWLICDGSAVSRTAYANLFAVLGTTWGAGDGVTTFNLPDLRGRAGIGAGTGTGLSPRVLAAKGGEETHSLTVNEQADMPVTVAAIPLSIDSQSFAGPGGSWDRASTWVEVTEATRHYL